MTKWIVSTPLKGTDLMKNFVCFEEAELRKLLEQYPDASVKMKDSHLEDYPEMKDYSLISTSQTENYIQVKDARYTLDEFNRIGELLLGRNLTDDQQVVLEWLTENIHLGTLPFNQISLLNQSFFNSPIDTSDKYLKAFGDLDSQEQFQVLAAFAEWGMAND